MDDCLTAAVTQANQGFLERHGGGRPRWSLAHGSRDSARVGQIEAVPGAPIGSDPFGARAQAAMGAT